MAAATREIMQSVPSEQLSFEDKLGLVVDREWSDRDNRRVARRIKEARLGALASLEQIDCDTARGLDEALVRQLNAVADVSSRERAGCHAHLRRYF